MCGSYRMNLLLKDIDLLLSIMFQGFFFLVRLLLFLSRDFQNRCLINHWVIDSVAELVKKTCGVSETQIFLMASQFECQREINLVSGEVGFVL